MSDAQREDGKMTSEDSYMIGTDLMVYHDDDDDVSFLSIQFTLYISFIKLILMKNSCTVKEHLTINYFTSYRRSLK
jgi:hypothetical protein